MSDPRELSREELLAALAERDAVIAALLAEIEQLKRRVGMDSSSSSMPPGPDGLAARARRARKPGKRSPRPRGGQPGHEGHALAWRSEPDRVTVVTPGQCAGCGHDLAGLEGTVAARVQASGTPPVRLQVTRVPDGRGGLPGMPEGDPRGHPGGAGRAVLLRPGRAGGDGAAGL